MPATSKMLHGFGGKRETMTELRERLSQPQFTSALEQDHLSWADDTLDQTLNLNPPHDPPTLLKPPVPEEWHLSSKARGKRPAKELEEES